MRWLDGPQAKPSCQALPSPIAPWHEGEGELVTVTKQDLSVTVSHPLAESPAELFFAKPARFPSFKLKS